MNDKNRRILLCVVLTAVLVIFIKMPAISGQHFKPILASIPHIIPKSDLGKGKFLVASRDLIDPNFSQIVVLLLEYVPEGAMGVVINRPTKVKLYEVLPDMKELKQRSDTMYIGGPVSRNQMIMLVKSPSKPEASIDATHVQKAVAQHGSRPAVALNVWSCVVTSLIASTCAAMCEICC